MDSAPMHRFQAVKKSFRDHPEVMRITYPPKSPDLMPIENLWAKMVSEWNDNIQRNKENFVLCTQSIWDKCRSDDICNRLVMNMPNRIRKMIKKAGFFN